MFISKNADAYLYTSCALILKHQIILLSRELLRYFRLLSLRHINVGRIQMHTLWSKTRAEHVPSDTHTRDLFLLQLNVVPMLWSPSETANLLITCKGSLHKTSCFYYSIMTYFTQMRHKRYFITTLVTEISRESPGDFSVQIN